MDVDATGNCSDVLATLRSAGNTSGLTLVGVDGRSGSGKTTFADKLSELAADVAIVRTDDIAWHHSFFSWSPLLVDCILVPLREKGPPLRFRPDAWRERGRAGAIAVAANASIVVVEGVGACNRAVAPLLDVCIWIEADRDVAARRVAARGVDSPEFIADWAAQEEAFLAEHEPWTYADLVVSGVSTA